MPADANPGMSKKNGSAAAVTWLATAPVQLQLEVAGSRFEYGHTLDELRSEGIEVPSSADVDFSWGFFKKVKSHLHHKLRPHN